MVFTVSRSGSEGPGKHTEASLQGRGGTKKTRTKAALLNNRTNSDRIHPLASVCWVHAGSVSRAGGRKKSSPAAVDKNTAKSHARHYKREIPG